MRNVAKTKPKKKNCYLVRMELNDSCSDGNDAAAKLCKIFKVLCFNSSVCIKEYISDKWSKKTEGY